MRNTFFDMDEDSTIVSMLAVRERPDARQLANSHLVLKIIWACIALFLLILYLSRGTPWQ